jgi:hypothetical protein
MEKKQPKVIRDLYEKGIWATRDNLFDKLRVAKKLREQEEEPGKPGLPADLISQIQGVLQKYGVKSARSFLGWDLSGGIADDRTFLSLGVKEEGFCLSSKSGSFSNKESQEAQSRLTDIIACLNDLSSVAPNLVAE